MDTLNECHLRADLSYVAFFFNKVENYDSPTD